MILISIFFLALNLSILSKTPVIYSEIGHKIDFNQTSQDIFNDMLIMNGYKKGKLSQKRNADFFDNYEYGKDGGFFDSSKISIWDVIGEGAKAVLYEPFPYKIISSSFLNNSSSYKAENLYDNSFKTVWVEGVKGHGIGEFFFFFLNN